MSQLFFVCAGTYAVTAVSRFQQSKLNEKWSVAAVPNRSITRQCRSIACHWKTPVVFWYINSICAYGMQRCCSVWFYPPVLSAGSSRGRVDRHDLVGWKVACKTKRFGHPWSPFTPLSRLQHIYLKVGVNATVSHWKTTCLSIFDSKRKNDDVIVTFCPPLNRPLLCISASYFSGH